MLASLIKFSFQEECVKTNFEITAWGLIHTKHKSNHQNGEKTKNCEKFEM